MKNRHLGWSSIKKKHVQQLFRSDKAAFSFWALTDYKLLLALLSADANSSAAKVKEPVCAEGRFDTVANQKALTFSEMISHEG